MSCTSPRCALIPFEGGRPKFLEGDYPVGSHPLGRIVYLPCGGCLSCRIERRQELTLLQCCEASLYDENWFLTLTYEDWKTIQLEGIPPYSLDRSHLSRFTESMRKYCRYNGFDFRYFACGEYGDHYGRPHYHLSIFGLPFSLLRVGHSLDDTAARQRGLNYGRTVKLATHLLDDNGVEFWQSPVISDRWPFGSHKIYRATRETFQYVAGYVTKKLSGDLARDFTKDCRVLPFSAQSRPSIGFPWFHRFLHSLSIPDRDKLVNDVLSISGCSWKTPRIFDKWLSRMDHFDGHSVVDHLKYLRTLNSPDMPDRVDLQRKADFLRHSAERFKQNNTHMEL